MSSDKRVLIIGAVTMVLLLAIGVVGAALFTRSACGELEGDRVEGGRGALALAPLLEEPSTGEDADVVQRLQDHVDELEQLLGPVSGVVNVPGADSLATAGDGGVIAVGEQVSVIAPDGVTVEAAASFSSPARVVGDGDGLYSLALMNELTGQVDALMPLNPDLEAGSCVDTAVVGEPFAFHLDAAAGDLLLFRVEEDAAGPELELRDAADGRAWTTALEVPTAPPGILAERISARLGDDVVVSARRVIPGEDEPAIVAFDRADGAFRWQVPTEAVVASLTGDEPAWAQVLRVADGIALVGVSSDGDDRPVSELVAVTTSDGNILWRTVLDDPPSEVSDAAVGAAAVAVAADHDGEVEILVLDRSDGRLAARSMRFAGGQGRLAVRDDGSFVVTTDAGTTSIVTADGEPMEWAVPSVRVHDVVTIGAATTLLLEGSGGQTMAVTFGG